MRTISHMLAFLFAFTLEVRMVGANNLEMIETPLPNIFVEPQGCHLTEDEVCAVKNLGPEEFAFHLGKNRVYLAPGAIFIRNSSNKGSHVQGSVYVRALERFEVSSAYGEIRWQRGEALLEKNDERIYIYGITTDVDVQRKGAVDAEVLPVGFYNWIGPVSMTGESATTVAQPAHIPQMIRAWAPAYPGTFQSLTKELRAYRIPWMAAVEGSSEWHKSLAERYIANVKAERVRQQRLKEKRERESREMRKLFRKKNYMLGF
jgi:hypothetical protein